MKTSLQIGRIFDIPIKIHFSFLIILALFVWFFSFQSFTILGFVIGFGAVPLTPVAQVVFGIILAILFFSCLLLHELGHSYVTLRNGYGIQGITLFIFGGASQLEETPEDPKLELKIAIVGPAISLLLGILFLLIYQGLLFFSNSMVIQVGLVMAGTLTFYNFLLGFFNLVPAFPVDGGRVLRAFLAMQMDYQRATKNASNIGRGIAIGIAILGILVLNVWLILIGVFIYFGASQEEKSTEISMALKGVKVKDIMTQKVAVVSPDMTLQEITDFMMQHRHMGYPVVEDNKLQGIITFNDVHNVTREKHEEVEVKDIMSSPVKTVSPNDGAMDAFKLMARNNIGRLVVTVNTTVEGIVSRSDIMHAVRMKGI